MPSAPDMAVPGRVTAPKAHSKPAHLSVLPKTAQGEAPGTQSHFPHSSERCQGPQFMVNTWSHALSIRGRGRLHVTMHRGRGSGGPAGEVLGRCGPLCCAVIITGQLENNHTGFPEKPTEAAAVRVGGSRGLLSGKEAGGGPVALLGTELPPGLTLSQTPTARGRGGCPEVGRQAGHL